MVLDTAALTCLLDAEGDRSRCQLVEGLDFGARREGRGDYE